MLGGLLLALAWAQEPEPEQGPGEEPLAPDDQTLESTWRDLLRFRTEDGTHRLRLGGRIHFDTGVIPNDRRLTQAVGALEDATAFRRARFKMQGWHHEYLQWKLEVGLRGGQARFLGTYIELDDHEELPSLRFGYFREPVGLDAVTGGSFLTFLERNLATELAPGRNTGFMAYDQLGSDVNWAAGVFRDATRQGAVRTDGDFGLTGRLTWTPWADPQAGEVLHLGVSGSHRDPLDSTVAFAGRPESLLVPALVDTGPFTAGALLDIGLEAAWIARPWSFQAEWIQARARSAPNDDPVLDGRSLQASYFLTGESRAYRRAGARYRVVRPDSDFLADGTGAWELALRWSELDLDDGPIQGGTLRDWTLALNWYLNASARVLGNLILADLQGVGSTEILQIRLAVEF